MHKDFNPGDIVDVKIEIPLPPLEAQVGIIACTAETHPEEAKRTLKLGIANALSNGTEEEAATLLQLMMTLFGQSEYNQFVGELIVAAFTGDLSKLF